MGEKLNKLRKTFINHGELWDDDEERLLVEEYEATQSIEYLSKLFGRSPNAILLKLYKNGKVDESFVEENWNEFSSHM